MNIAKEHQVWGQGVMTDQDIETIKSIIEEKSKRYQSKMGEVTFAGIDGGTVKIAPSGFCWR